LETDALAKSLGQAAELISASCGQAFSVEERKAFMDHVRRCWNVPASATSKLKKTGVIAFSMTQDGEANCFFNPPSEQRSW
jgi:hypothetical protein